MIMFSDRDRLYLSTGHHEQRCGANSKAQELVVRCRIPKSCALVNTARLDVPEIGVVLGRTS